METIIRNATQMWCADPIHLRNPLQFLQLCSHCVIDSCVENAILRISSQENNYSISPAQSIVGCPDEHIMSTAFKSTTPRKNKPITTAEDNASKYVTTDPLVDIQTMVGLQCDTPITASNELNKRSDPPPLAFFPKANGKTQRPIIISATQPPPLVPIDRRVR